MSPLCPFSRSRIDATLCPGYAPEPVPTAPIWPFDRTLPPVQACAHLQVERRRRGFVPVCSRPSGLPITEDRFAELRRRRLTGGD